MNLAEVQGLLREVSYKGWRFECGLLGRDSYFLRARFRADEEEWKSRKWLISCHATPSEVVQTAFLCVQTAEEHELREAFQFRGRAIFGPHISVYGHWTVAHHLDERPELVPAGAKWPEEEHAAHE